MNPIQAAIARPLKPLPDLAQGQGMVGTEKSPVEEAEATREAFSQFIGKTFFGQMLKAMRKSAGKPAYFHGGQAEEIFRSQLDQTLADVMTQASADTLAEPLFERQFPHHAAVLKEHEKADAVAIPALNDLVTLRRR